MSGTENIEERILIEKCRGGDSAAFGLLVKRYNNQLFTYLCRLSRDRVYAEDLFQETLIKVWKGFKKYDERKKFSSWLFSIAHNVFLDGYRHASAHKRSAFEKDLHMEQSHVNPEKDYFAKETVHLLKQEVEKLPMNQKKVFLLRQHGNMTFKEISEIMNEPLNTVLSHMHYAVKKLKKSLEEINA
jgi:RNA polymerase sigma-70 factor (ECF subfamily)